MTTQLIKCNCKSEFQDQQYGPGNRVANEMRTGQLKCTVCGAVGGSKMVFAPKAETAPVAAATPKSSGKSKEKSSSKEKAAPKAKLEKGKKK